MGRGRDFREPRRRGFEDDDFSPPPFLRPSPSFQSRPAPAATGPTVSAVVKWFNPEKGFGFVELSDGSGDAFLHVGALERSGHGAVSPGATLQVRVGQGQKGPQVTEVLEVDESTAAAEAPRRERPAGPRPSREPDLGSAVEMSGTVKWYNDLKGFGFISPDGGGKDVFVHVSALQRSGVTGLPEGQRVTMQVVEGRKGPEAASIALRT